MGTGGVGLSIIMALRLVGANPIIAVDLSEEKLAAREFGAICTLMPSENLADEIAAITGEAPHTPSKRSGGRRPSSPFRR